jgi:hypothetical protein
MVAPPGEARLRWLEANAHRPEVQETIRREIARGRIRVIPTASGRIRIVPVWASDPSDHGNTR